MAQDRIDALYESAQKLKISDLTDDDAQNAAAAFAYFDKDGSGEIDVSELKEAFNKAGHKITGHETREVIKNWTRKDKNVITWEDFLNKFNELRLASDVGRTFEKHTAAKEGLERIHKGKSMKSYHSYAVEDRVGFADWCNRILGKDPDLAHLMPIRLEDEDLFEKVKDGILLCKLINSAIADTIDERSINKVKPGKTSIDAFRQIENLNLALNSAKAIGATVINVGYQDIVDGRAHLVLSIMWQVIEIGLMAGVSLDHNPHIAALLEEDEELSDLQRLGPEGILLRWINFHLRNDKSYEGPPVVNFKSSLKDSRAYIHLLAQIQPEDMMPRISNCEKSEPDTDLDRAEMMLKNADRLDCRVFLRPSDVVQEKNKLNLAFIANLFNKHPMLDAGDVLVIEETREEKTYRNWINSLGASPRIIRIYNDIKNGCALYDVLQKIDPKVCEKYKIDRPPYKKFSEMLVKLGNLDRVISIGKEMKFTLIGISGSDIYDENKKLTLALLWQMMRAYTVKVLVELGDGKPVTDNDILEWANSKLSAVTKLALSKTQLSPLLCPSIGSSMPLRLIPSIFH